MRILVCGGREYDDWFTLDTTLRSYNVYDETVIIEGGTKGADFLARVWAKDNFIPFEEYPADWKRFGKNAGFIRNKDMLLKGKPDLVIAFPGGKGTAHMVKIAKKNNVEVIEIE